MSKLISALILAWFLLIPHAANAEQERYLIGIPCFNQQACSLPELESIMREGYRRIGMNVSFRYLPFLRSIDEANSGILDASAARTMVAARGYSNLIPVPVPLFKLSYSAVTTKPGIKINSFDNTVDYTIGIQRGNMAAIMAAESAGNQVYLFNSMVGAFNMLEAGRLDMIVMDATIASHIAKSIGHGAILLSEPLYSVLSYHFLNKKHKGLVPKLAHAFKGMYEDGTAKQLMGKYLPMMPDKASGSLSE